MQFIYLIYDGDKLIYTFLNKHNAEVFMNAVGKDKNYTCLKEQTMDHWFKK